MSLHWRYGGRAHPEFLFAPGSLAGWSAFGADGGFTHDRAGLEWGFAAYSRYAPCGRDEQQGQGRCAQEEGSSA